MKIFIRGVLYCFIYWWFYTVFLISVLACVMLKLLFSLCFFLKLEMVGYVLWVKYVFFVWMCQNVIFLSSLICKLRFIEVKCFPSLMICVLGFKVIGISFFTFILLLYSCIRESVRLNDLTLFTQVLMILLL